MAADIAAVRRPWRAEVVIGRLDPALGSARPDPSVVVAAAEVAEAAPERLFRFPLGDALLGLSELVLLATLAGDGEMEKGRRDLSRGRMCGSMSRRVSLCLRSDASHCVLRVRHPTNVCWIDFPFIKKRKCLFIN